MNDKPKVRLVEAHAQGDRSDQSFDSVVEQLLFGFDSLGGFQIGVIGARHDSPLPEPLGHAPRVLHRERVNDAGPGNCGKK